MASLVAPDQTWALWTVLFSAAAFGLWSERTVWGRRVSSAVATIGVTFVLSNVGIIPVSAPTYDAVWSYFVPLAIPMLLLRANLGRIVREAGPTLAAFSAGAVGTVLGTIVAFRLVPLGPEGYKLAGIFCATYIGGSLNYVAASEVLDLRAGDLLTAGIAADNLVMTLYFLVLFALPSIPRLRAAFVQRHLEDASESTGAQRASSDGFGLFEVAAGVALAALLCAVGFALAELAGVPSVAILVVTALAVALATALPRWLARLAVVERIGTLLMMVFFAVIGAGANVGVVARQGPILFVFAAIILTVHLASILLIGKLLRLDLAEIVVASNANMGGPTTAAAMASARRWTTLVTPAILCGTLGYAAATFIGAAVGNLLR